MNDEKIDRHTCGHPDIGPKTLQCPRCHGILRRCCDTVLSTEHKLDCDYHPRKGR